MQFEDHRYASHMRIPNAECLPGNPIAEYTIERNLCDSRSMHICRYIADGNSHPQVSSSRPENASGLAKKSSRNIPHICFLKLIVFPVVSVDVDVVECLYNSVNVETHVDKPVNQIFVIALISVHTSVQIQTLMSRSLT
jgi:hypothetical protein